MVALDALSQDALLLPPEQRMALAYRLLASVESNPELGADAAWKAKISARIARFDAGQAQTATAVGVFASLGEIATG